MEILADFPYARNDKFLSDTFKQMCDADTKQKADARNQAQQTPARTEEIDHAATLNIEAAKELERQKRKIYAIEKTMEMVHGMAQKGVDISPFISQDKEGNITMDWAGIAAASAKAKQSAPPPVDTKTVVDDIMAAGNAVPPGK